MLLLLTSVILQVSVLDESACVHPNTWWWIKADGTDLVSGLGESVAGVWNVDVDLADNALIKAWEAREERIDFISQIRGQQTTSD